MVLTKEQIAEFKQAATPLMKWMNENLHPHTTALVNGSAAEVLKGLAVVGVEGEEKALTAS